MKTKNVPHIEATNFDRFIDEDDYKEVDVKAFKLETVYPNFYKEGYNYRAIASYKIKLSDKFYSIVVTVKRGDNEMESTLINYDLDGNIIGHQMIAYDEIAEGMFRAESKITNKGLVTNQVAWYEEPQIEQSIYRLTNDGMIDELNTKVLNNKLPNIPLILLALDGLQLNLLNIKTELVVSETHPDNPDDFIVVIPEIKKEEENYLEFNSHIIIVNGSSGEVMQKSVINGLTSEGEDVIKSIKIDKGPYLVTENTHAFGIIIHRYGNITVTPWENESLELFVKSGDTLNSILQNFNVMNYGGEIISDCEGGDTRNTSVLYIQTEHTNGYYDILVETKIIDTENFPDENGECNITEKLSTQHKVLKYNGDVYL